MSEEYSSCSRPANPRLHGICYDHPTASFGLSSAVSHDYSPGQGVSLGISQEYSTHLSVAAESMRLPPIPIGDSIDSAGLSQEVSHKLKQQLLDVLKWQQAAVANFAEVQQHHIQAAMSALLESELLMEEGETASLMTDERAMGTVKEALASDEVGAGEQEQSSSRDIKSPKSPANRVRLALQSLTFPRISVGSSDQPGAKLYSSQAADHEGGTLDLIIGCVILVNVVITIVQLELRGRILAADLGVEEGAQIYHEHFFFVAEHIFNAIYIIELTIRVCTQRRRYLDDFSNAFDVLLVVVSSLDLYVVGVTANLRILRSFRLMKTVRTLRTARFLKLIRGLRTLVKTIISGLCALGWSLVLLGLVIVVCGLAICQLVQTELTNPAYDLELQAWMWRYYGSAGRASYTMFEILFAGSWPTMVRPLFEGVSWWYCSFFVVYVTFVVFAMKTIISALFLKDTLSAASQDLEEVLAEATKKKAAYMSKLRNFFEEADTSGDGSLSQEEFEAIIANPKVKQWLNVLELEVSESSRLFRLLAEGGEVTVDQFMHGVARLKGQSRSVDTVSIMRDVWKLQEQTQEILQMLRDGPPRAAGENAGSPFTPFTSGQPLLDIGPLGSRRNVRKKNLSINPSVLPAQPPLTGKANLMQFGS